MADPAQQDPSFSGAIIALMRALASSFAPRSMVQRPIAVNDAVEGQPPPQVPPPAATPQTTPAMKKGLGNQSPGLGNSF